MVVAARIRDEVKDLVLGMLASAFELLRERSGVNEIWISDNLLLQSIWILKQRPSFASMLEEIDVRLEHDHWPSDYLEDLLWSGHCTHCEVRAEIGLRIMTVTPLQTVQCLDFFKDQYGGQRLGEVEDLAKALVRVMEKRHLK